MLIRGDIIEKRSLKAKFPDLEFRKVRMIASAEDGEVLPEDPDWKGKLKRRR